MKRIFVFVVLTVFCLGAAARIVRAQCGADGTQPCRSEPGKSVPKVTKKSVPKPPIIKQPTKPIVTKPIIKKLVVKTAVEEKYWEQIKDSRDKSAFEAYLKEYPTGTYAPLARLKIGELAKSAANAVAAGTVRRNSIGMELVYIPAGEFMMGSSEADLVKSLAIYQRYVPKAERSWIANQTPQRKVTFKQGYWMGRFEVTQQQWQSVMGTTIRQHRDKYVSSNAIQGEGISYPMYFVSWDDAKEFVGRLNERNDGFIYSLPSEAEWEYAARGGTSNLYYWGDDSDSTEICRYANIFDLSRKPLTAPNYLRSIAPCSDGFVETAPIGSLRPNSFGLYDMIGNVSEWCEDTYLENYSNLPADGTAVKNASNSRRVMRGGSFGGLAMQTMANRSQPGQDWRSVDYGFRVAARMK